MESELEYIAEYWINFQITGESEELPPDGVKENVNESGIAESLAEAKRDGEDSKELGESFAFEAEKPADIELETSAAESGVAGDSSRLESDTENQNASMDGNTIKTDSGTQTSPTEPPTASSTQTKNSKSTTTLGSPGKGRAKGLSGTSVSPNIKLGGAGASTQRQTRPTGGSTNIPERVSSSSTTRHPGAGISRQGLSGSRITPDKSTASPPGAAGDKSQTEANKANTSSPSGSAGKNTPPTEAGKSRPKPEFKRFVKSSK